MICPPSLPLSTRSGPARLSLAAALSNVSNPISVIINLLWQALCYRVAVVHDPEVTAALSIARRDLNSICPLIAIKQNPSCALRSLALFTRCVDWNRSPQKQLPFVIIEAPSSSASNLLTHCPCLLLARSL